MLIKKEIKYGYSSGTKETSRKRRLVKPSNLTKIRLTPINSKFLFYGTRNDILKWMSLHPDSVVIYDPIAKDDDELALSPPSSPINPNYLDVPDLLPSPTSITSPISPLSPSSPISPSSPSSLASSLSSDSILSTNTTSETPRDIVFDLFTIPVKTSELLSEEASFNRPLNIALKCIPWIEVMLEIRPVDERKDSKLFPLHRVILPSGSSLSEISKALEKSWKSLIPDSTAFGPDCFIRNSELIYPQNKSKSNDVKSKSISSDEEEYHKSNGFMAGIAKRVPTVDLWLRQKQTSGAIPPGILTPYIIDDVLEDLNEEKKKDDEKVLEEKKMEAELDKELPKLDLPQYENIYWDFLLEKGK